MTARVLLLPGWRSSLAAIFGGMVVSWVAFGLFFVYWRFTDQDLFLAYQGLLLNDGLPQEYFDHTGYLYHLLIAAWYWLLHQFGVLPAHAISELPPVQDVVAFDAAWQRLIQAGRALSLIIAGCFVGTFTLLLRRLLGDWRIAAFAGFALAFSGGVAMHLRIMRTELLSASLVTTALLLVLVAVQEPRLRWRPFLLGLAALCAVLAIETKVQALFLVAPMPLVAFAFAWGQPREAQVSAWSGRGGWLLSLVLATVAAAAVFPTSALVLRGIATTTTGFRIGVGPAGLYQAGIVVWFMAALATFGLWRRVAAAEMIAALAAIALGVCLGLAVLQIRFHEQNLLALSQPIEYMFGFAKVGVPDLSDAQQVFSSSLLLSLAKGFGRALAHHTFVLSTSPRPTLMLEWLAIAGAIIAWRRGDRLLPGRVALLLATVWSIDTVFTLRGLKLEYFVYTDPLLILAAALTLAHFPGLIGRIRTSKLALLLAMVYVIWAHAEPVKPLFARKQPETRILCPMLDHYLPRIEKFPFCRG